jgi:Uma2 family endonuclease
MTVTQERPAAAPKPVSEEALVDVPQEDLLRPRRWTTAEYYALSDAGFFDDERVELLDGEIWTLPAQKTPHFSAVEAAAEALLSAFGSGFTARRHGPMTLENGTEPEPDLLIVPGSWRDYAQVHPTPTEASLLVEVSDATLRKDRTKKLNDYARAGIADYWIINLVNRQLEVYRDPAPMNGSHGYKTVQTLFDGDTISPLSAPNGLVAVADLFPPLQPPQP